MLRRGRGAVVPGASAQAGMSPIAGPSRSPAGLPGPRTVKGDGGEPPAGPGEEAVWPLLLRAGLGADFRKDLTIT